MKFHPILFCVVMFSLNGCSLVSQKNAAPVIEATPYDIQHKHTHVVKKGDTLYTIAWRYGLDYHELAKRNRLDSAHHIKIGQVLKLDGGAITKPAAKTEKKPEMKLNKTVTLPSSTLESGSSASTQKTVEKQKKISSQSSLKWDWPVKGEILKQYGLNKAQANKGIDIGGVLGKPIHTAAPGEVVYAGSGLRGYGQVIILKHDETYLSAYAHNQTILVNVGDKVTAGQTIAHMGCDHQQIKLHFEIRKNGKPIDPLSVLPKII